MIADCNRHFVAGVPLLAKTFGTKPGAAVRFALAGKSAWKPEMGKRRGNCATRILAAAAIVSAGVTPVSAQIYEPLVFAYGQLSRPMTYLRGRMSPYIDQKADFFGGIDAAKANTFAWMGVTWAPMGVLAEDGWRVRLVGGAGRYSYQTQAAPGGINDANVFSGEVLGGYRKTFGNVFGRKLYLGAFAGLHYEDQLLVYEDRNNPARGSEAGIKGSLELYSRVGERYIATAFASLSSVHNKYHAKAAALYELNDMWALGGEVAVLGDARYDEQRAGLVGSLTWRKRIFTLSAGFLDNSSRGEGTYLTLSVYSPF